MRTRMIHPLALVVIGLLLARSNTAHAPARAQSGGGYDLSWSTVDVGGGTSTGGPLALSGTIGQSDAGDLAGESTALKGGYWAGRVSAGGDCNGDGSLDAGDMSALVLEIFDADGALPVNAPQSTFVGDPDGCDANRDNTVNAGDMSCTVIKLFGGPGGC